MAEKTDVELFLEYMTFWVEEGIYPVIGPVVQKGIAKLEAEGFTNEEARYWLEALTILQTVRMGVAMPPFQHTYWVPDPPVLTEYDIMRMITAGETIPGGEYKGFEGYY